LHAEIGKENAIRLYLNKTVYTRYPFVICSKPLR